MEISEVSDLFPLFSTTNTEVIEWLLSVIETEQYAPGEVIIREEDWGKSVCFIVSGWVKLESYMGNQDITLDVRSKSDYFGEIAVLDEPIQATEAIALSAVSLLSLSAQRFLQMLFKDPQLQHKILHLTVKRIRHCYHLSQIAQQSPQLKLIKTLINLAEIYGQSTERGIEIFNIPSPDLADLANIKLEEAQEILIKLQSKGWVEVNSAAQILSLPNLKNLNHFVNQLLA